MPTTKHLPKHLPKKLTATKSLPDHDDQLITKFGCSDQYGDHDVRLRVFYQDFHVHAHILKQHCAYFERLMKYAKDVVTGTEFRFEYIAVIDPDGSWGLENASKTFTATDTKRVPADRANCDVLPHEKKTRASESFEKILCAMYGHPDSISSAEEFHEMVKLADFYCALPTLSGSISDSLTKSPDFIKNLHHTAHKTIIDAMELRHGPLFKECLVHAASTYKPGAGRRYKWKDDEYLVELMDDITGPVDCLLVDLNRELYESFSAPEDFRYNMIKFQMQSKFDLSGPTSIRSKKCFREIKDQRRLWRSASQALKDLIDEALQNHLALSEVAGSEVAEVVEQKTEDVFLCAAITDEMLPWDSEEDDWSERIDESIASGIRQSK